MQIDEAAMKVITDKLVDPWHRTFARDVVEMYLKHSYKHPLPMQEIIRQAKELGIYRELPERPTQNPND